MISSSNSPISSTAFSLPSALLGGANASLSGAAALAGGKTMDPSKVDATAKDFESMFISQMVEQMFGESVGDEAFGTSDTQDVYKGMMVQEYGKMISKAGGIGIADYVKRELLKLQEK